MLVISCLLSRCAFHTAIFLAVISLCGCMFTQARCDANSRKYKESVAASFSAIGFDIEHTVNCAVLPSECITETSDSITVDFDHCTQRHANRYIHVSPWAKSIIDAKVQHGNASDYLKVMDLDFRTCRLNDGVLKDLQFKSVTGSNRPVRIARRLHYIYTVPLDIATLPLQAVYAGVCFALLASH